MTVQWGMVPQTPARPRPSRPRIGWRGATRREPNGPAGDAGDGRRPRPGRARTHVRRNGDRVPPGGLVTVRARARARLRIGAASVSARGARLAAACARRQGLLVLL